MFNRQQYLSFLRKVVLLCLMGSYPSYSQVAAPIFEPPLETERDPAAEFLSENLHITGGDYDRSIGTLDLFMMGKKHHFWKQVGVGGLHLVGVGAGYRYLFKGDHIYQDWFLGVYGYAGWFNTKHHPLLKWNTGIELATAHLHWTINGYGAYRIWPEKYNQAIDYLEGSLGYSLRVSSYYFQKMKMVGRVNLFGFLSHTRLRAAQDGRELDPLPLDPLPLLSCRTWVWRGGVGARWELSSYVACEYKMGWDELTSGIAPTRHEVGFQINFAGRIDSGANYATHRVREMPQAYEASYSLRDPAGKFMGMKEKLSPQEQREESIDDSDQESEQGTAE